MGRTILFVFFFCLFISCSKHHGETYSFKGEIGKKIGVTGYLEINNKSLTGSYYYDIFKRPVSILGTIEGDKVVFKGFDPDGEWIDYFDGYINEDSSISGVWSSADGERSMPFYYSSTVKKSRQGYLYYLPALLIPFALVVYAKRNKPFSKSIRIRGNKQESLIQARIINEYQSKQNKERTVKSSDPIEKTQSRHKNVKTASSPRTVNDKYSFESLLKDDEESKRKGKAFERFVKERFDSKYYKWMESRSDDRYGKDSPESNKYPDFVFSLRYNEEGLNDSFAVECKYRSKLQKVGGMYQLFASRQFDNYLDYSQSNNYPTFVILGVGGQASSPKSIYIIPLERLEPLEGKYKESVGIRASELGSYMKRKYVDFRFFRLVRIWLNHFWTCHTLTPSGPVCC